MIRVDESLIARLIEVERRALRVSLSASAPPSEARADELSYPQSFAVLAGCRAERAELTKHLDSPVRTVHLAIARAEAEAAAWREYAASQVAGEEHVSDEAEVSR